MTVIDHLNELWTGLLHFLSTLIIPDWSALIGLLPLFLGYLNCAGSRLYASVRYGLIYGLVIFVSYVVAHLLVEHKILEAP